MSKKIEIGTRVMFSRTFLRATGQYTGWAPFARGKIEDAASPLLVYVRWDHDDTRSLVNIGNLVREDRLHLESQ